MEEKLIKEYEKEIGSVYDDRLTGLFNHGLFQVYLDQEIKKSKRYLEPFTLALVDVDNFSLYNSASGSVKGDLLLKQLANIIKENLRSADLAARYSGDVFAIVMTKAGTNSAYVAAERIRDAVEKKIDTAVTVSIGLASFPNDGNCKNELFNRAEEALLQAKIRGKNKVFYFSEEEIPQDDSKPIILIVDDEQRNLKLLEAMLIPLGYNVIKTANGKEALSIVQKVNIDLILLDIMMPGMDGFEVCQTIKANKSTRLIPIVMVTALDDMDYKIKAINAGADDFLTKPPNKTELLARTKSLVKMKNLNKNLASIENVLISLANTVEAKDGYTQGHIERVSTMAVALGKKLRLTGKEIVALRLGGALHDIGKIAISESILNKPGPLNGNEWKIMKNHAEIGHKICIPLKGNLGLALEVVRHHHEKLDGSGYPDGLKGDEIPKIARVMAVVDIYDALVTDRPYRKGMDSKKAISIIREEGRQGKLDQEIIEYLAEMVMKNKF